VGSDVDGLLSDVVCQLLSTVLKLEDEDNVHDVGLKELRGEY